MANTTLHSFVRDLANVPPKGSAAPPRSIRAKDLDGNFKKATVIPPGGTRPAYGVRYTQDGTILTNIGGSLPSGAIAKQFDVCENGTPVQYWLVYWEEEPTLG